MQREHVVSNARRRLCGVAGGLDDLLGKLLAAQADWAAVEAIPGNEGAALLAPVRERREQAFRAALAGGVPPRAVARVTGLGEAELAELRARGDDAQ
jgi:hypothetical protein